MMTRLQSTNLRNFIQKETLENIVEEITTFGNTSFSNNDIHVIFASSRTIRAVSHLQYKIQVIHVMR